jgi:hypothetical protein
MKINVTINNNSAFSTKHQSRTGVRCFAVAAITMCPIAPLLAVQTVRSSQEQEQKLEEELWSWVSTSEVEPGRSVEPQEASGGQQDCRRRRWTRTTLRRCHPQ